LPSLLSRH